MKRYILLLFILLTGLINILAQPRVSKVEINLVPDHSSGIYHIGQNALIDLSVTDCGMLIDSVTINYEVAHEMMAPHITKSLTLNGNSVTINIGSMKEPGFLRIKATLNHKGKTYSAISTVGFEPERLRPMTKRPKDFTEFWNKGIEKMKAVDLAPIMTLVPERCTDKVDVYDISYGNIGNSRMYGTLAIPRGEGQFPAILRLPGGGFYPRLSDTSYASQGVIVLDIGIHGIPVNMPVETYQHLNKMHPDYMSYNMDNPLTFYYYRAFLGSLKAVDFLQSLPQCNGQIGTIGGSQGGALSIVVSALDSRIKATAAYHPGLCDLEGFLHGRAGGFPFYFRNEENRTPQKLSTLQYYDVANFAPMLKSPVHYTYGYNDTVCTPTSTCATYNVISAPKTLVIAQNIGHWLYPELSEGMWAWLIDQLKNH